MLDRLLNNRKEWNALKEVHEAKLAEIEAANKAKEEAAEKAVAARQGRRRVYAHTHTHTGCFTLSTFMCDVNESKQSMCQC